jgi:ribosomal-protein-alanine N-acetyltransferase
VLLVFTDQNTIRGFVVAAEIAREWELENIAVRNSGRRQGTADQLMEALLKELQSSRAECLHLEVRESNTPARTLYEKWGFRVSGRRTRYYHNPSEDAILYRKNLSPAAPEIR